MPFPTNGQIIITQRQLRLAERTTVATDCTVFSHCRTDWCHPNVTMYVYHDNQGVAWTISLPVSVGNHPSLGFEFALGRTLPEIKAPYYSRSRTVRPRHLSLCRPDPDDPNRVPRYRSVPLAPEQHSSR